MSSPITHSTSPIPHLASHHIHSRPPSIQPPSVEQSQIRIMSDKSSTGNEKMCSTNNDRFTIDGVDDEAIVVVGGNISGTTKDGGSDDEFVPGHHESGDDLMDDGVEDTTEVSVSNALDEILEPQWLALVAKTKVIDDSPETGEVVTGWDASALRQSCLPSSPQYDQSINRGDICKVLFPPGQWWADKNMLLNALREYGKIFGFNLASNHNYIKCTRYGESTTRRNFSSGALASGCTFILYLKPMHMARISPKIGPDGKKSKARSREDWKRETCIIKSTTKAPHHSSCWSHGDKCSPSIKNLVDVTKRSGEYARIISSRQVFALCRQAKMRRLTASQIRGALHDLMPRNTNVTKQQVFNLRIKVMKLLPVIEENPEYATFSQYVNDKNILHGLDDEIDVNDDLAQKLATSLWLDALSENDHDQNGSVQTLTAYMDLLASSAPGFSYSISMDDEGKATGLAWMTGTTRDNFERYG